MFKILQSWPRLEPLRLRLKGDFPPEMNIVHNAINSLLKASLSHPLYWKCTQRLALSDYRWHTTLMLFLNGLWGLSLFERSSSGAHLPLMTGWQRQWQTCDKSRRRQRTWAGCASQLSGGRRTKSWCNPNETATGAFQAAAWKPRVVVLGSKHDARLIVASQRDKPGRKTHEKNTARDDFHRQVAFILSWRRINKACLVGSALISRATWSKSVSFSVPCVHYKLIPEGTERGKQWQNTVTQVAQDDNYAPKFTSVCCKYYRVKSNVILQITATWKCNGLVWNTKCDVESEGYLKMLSERTSTLHQI